RTALKDQMDLAFTLRSIMTGIISGTELYVLAIMTSVIITIALFTLDQLELKEAPRLLVVNGENQEFEPELNDLLNENGIYYTVKSRHINIGSLYIIYEILIENGKDLV